MNKVYDYFKEKFVALEEEQQEVKEAIVSHNLSVEAINDRLLQLRLTCEDSQRVFMSGHIKSEEVALEKDLCVQKDNLESELKELTARLADIEAEKSQIQEYINAISISNEEQKFFGEDYRTEFVGPIDGSDILKIQEIERKRMATELHDSVVQKLTALIHKSEFCNRLIDTDKSRVKMELGVIENVARECVNELRDIIYDLNVLQLSDLGVRTSIINCIDNIQKTTDMNITLNIPENFKPIDEFIAGNIIRTIRELCNNAIKHSRGSNINVKLFFRGQKVYIDVSDDGVGLDCKNITTGFGLSMIRERVALLEGKITCSNNKGKGSVFKIVLPTEIKSKA